MKKIMTTMLGLSLILGAASFAFGQDKTTATKKFYDLERLKFRGLSTEVDLGFDQSKILTPSQIGAAKARTELAADVNFAGISACGAPKEVEAMVD